ncbi:MAG: hypothetical protein KDA57_23410, partial [Planctomycetales bacterium]|nr:hypothetical protein [Planctomycetales bacterium]
EWRDRMSLWRGVSLQWHSPDFAAITLRWESGYTAPLPIRHVADLAGDTLVVRAKVAFWVLLTPVLWLANPWLFAGFVGFSFIGALQQWWRMGNLLQSASSSAAG